ncbi:MAG TPA: leucine-rich repeat domain-containing protein [Phycisphaerae bacterium]|nr:leucine-rich repeat domain-containing protein [Phycisphaerae bacterium]HRW54832.1 leucine-rich repeat domain-containing protein [Phycisphaerae bacterium]
MAGEKTDPQTIALERIREAKRNNTDRLNLSGLKLKSIPREIGELASLRSLSLDNNHLIDLPDWLGDLSDLTALYLSGNRLTAVPEGLGRLTTLTTLSLSNNLLTDLPEDIGELIALTTLWLHDNRLSDVPKGVGRLKSLTTLWLSGNRLTSLPERLDNLTALTTLWLSGNRLTSLPESLGALTSLKTLWLHDNRLTTMPEWLGTLIAVTELYLSGNRLTSLPKDLGALTALTTLWLHDNQLTTLPDSLAELEHLEELRIEDNPLDSALLAKAKEGTAALLAYLRATAGEKRYEVKLVFVGPGAVGKTCLLRCLQGVAPDADQKTTYGIDIAREPLDLPHPSEADKTIHLNCWDFGGQDVYEITHQFFFSRRSIYLVLWHPRLSNATETVGKWIGLIEQRVGDSARVIVVCTHARTDKHAKDIDSRALKGKFGDIILDFVEVDTFAPQTTGNGSPEARYGVAALRDRIADVAGTLPEPFPTRFRAPRKSLIAMARDKKDDPNGQGREWMRGEEFVAHLGEHKLSEDEAHELAELMDVQGHIIYHGGFGKQAGDCNELVILKPEWLAKAIGKVLEDPATRAASGILRHERLKDIWKDGDIHVPVELHGFLLQLMDRFDVSYGLENGDKNGRSLIPQLIRSAPPEKSLPWTPESEVRTGESQLSIVFDFFEPPRGLAPIATVHTHRYRKDDTLHWQRGVFLEYSDYGTAFVELRERELWLSARGAYPPHFLSLLIDTIERMLGTIWPGVKKNDPRGYTLAVPCYEKMADGSPCKGRDRLDALWLDLKDGEKKSRCRVCLKQRDVSRLALGFDSHGASIERVLQSQSEDMKREFIMTRNLIEDSWGAVREQLDGLIDQTWRLEKLSRAQLGRLAHLYKTFINAMETHRRDGPCLFSVVPDGKKLTSEKRRLTLWCEWPDGPHPCSPLFSGEPGDYAISRPRAWLVRHAPTISWMVRILKIAAPIAGAFGKEITSELGLDDIKANIGLMEEMVAALPSDELDVDGENWGKGAGESIHLPKGGRVSRLGETDLRVFHDFLREALPDRSWGNLRRAHYKGEFLWLCPRHFDQYDERRRRT